MNNNFVRTKKGEVIKAGRMFFDAVFGEAGDFERHLADEEEAPQPLQRQDLAGNCVVRCVGCAREQSVPASVDVRTLARHGWKFDPASRSWRCQFCA